MKHRSVLFAALGLAMLLAAASPALAQHRGAGALQENGLDLPLPPLISQLCVFVDCSAHSKCAVAIGISCGSWNKMGA